MDYEQKRAAADKLHAQARELRGRFLNLVAVIERNMALLITDYFCTIDPQKRELFFKQIATAANFSLNAKKQVLFAIVKQDYPKYWEEHQKILTAMDRIQRFRNKLAHSVLDVSEEVLMRPIEEGVSFLDWEAGRPITSTEFDDYAVDASMVLTCLEEIRCLLPFKEARV